MHSVESSITDYMAATAIKAQSEKNFNPKKKVLLLNGAMACQLKPSEQFYLEPALKLRCGGVTQENPVVRGMRNRPDYRFIQVGDKLYEVTCNITGQDKMYSLKEMLETTNHQDIIRLLASDQSLNQSEFGKQLKAGLKYLYGTEYSEQSRDFVLTMSQQCDELITARKY